MKIPTHKLQKNDEIKPVQTNDIKVILQNQICFQYNLPYKGFHGNISEKTAQTCLKQMCVIPNYI